MTTAWSLATVLRKETGCVTQWSGVCVTAASSERNATYTPVTPLSLELILAVSFIGLRIYITSN